MARIAREVLGLCIFERCGSACPCLSVLIDACGAASCLLLDESLPSGPSTSRFWFGWRAASVANSAAVLACSDSLFWRSWADGSGHAISPARAVAGIAAVVRWVAARSRRCALPRNSAALFMDSTARQASGDKGHGIGSQEGRTTRVSSS
jgi:hypothetical protein